MLLNDYYFQTEGKKTKIKKNDLSNLSNRELIIANYLYADYLESEFKGNDSFVFLS